MFTPEERSRVRSNLLEHAARDPRITGGAITGSAAIDREDRWSDIDLAFGVTDADEIPKVLSAWTKYMYGQHRALHHVDIRSGSWIYRVFLLGGALQVDLAFVTASEFQALAPTFRLVFGTTNEARAAMRPNPEATIGMGWLYAIHARSCIARGKIWQAEYMISGIRDHALALACLSHDLPAVHGRGTDQLPPAMTAIFEGSLVCKLETAELSRAFQVAVDGLLFVIQSVDANLAERLRHTLASLSHTAQ